MIFIGMYQTYLPMMTNGTTFVQHGKTPLVHGISTLTEILKGMVPISRQVTWSTVTELLSLVKTKMTLEVDLSKNRASLVKCMAWMCGILTCRARKSLWCRQVALMKAATICGGAISGPQVSMEMWALLLRPHAHLELSMRFKIS